MAAQPGFDAMAAYSDLEESTVRQGLAEILVKPGPDVTHNPTQSQLNHSATRPSASIVLLESLATMLTLMTIIIGTQHLLLDRIERLLPNRKLMTVTSHQ